jgi:hypothetical protein
MNQNHRPDYSVPEKEYGPTLLKLGEHVGECLDTGDHNGLEFIVNSICAILAHGERIADEMDRTMGTA